MIERWEILLDGRRVTIGLDRTPSATISQVLDGLGASCEGQFVGWSRTHPSVPMFERMARERAEKPKRPGE